MNPSSAGGRAAPRRPGPAEVADLGYTQPVPVGQQDHGGVAVTVPVAPRGLGQRLDPVRGEVLAGPELGVLLPLGETVRFTSVGATTRRWDLAI
jgi:hypothetical protein